MPGELPTGMQRTAAAADFGNGVSSGLPFEKFTFINPDLTVPMLRPPVGEWIGMDHVALRHAAVTSGAGFAESALYARTGASGAACRADRRRTLTKR